ncbi:hypothetical protein [Bradyrhizobium sp. SZCCHNPS2010]|uniref:hypothetical protein n=1 Tax=Bradyrhizobium sp. SZCCHNPS2010 TaxID=3057333 RepID=UPI00291668B0|nr:hypothetical protein [Bradyrhizobium sp. SZCCHNPS2010]
MNATWAERAGQKPEGDIRRAIMRGDLDRLSALFEETGNPAAAWLCWQLARKWQMPAPQAVAEEINRFADRLAALAIEALDGNARTVIDANAVASLWHVSPKASKGKTRRGATGLAEQLRLWDRDITVALRVHELRSRMPKKDALDVVSREMGIGSDNVNRIAEKYRRDFLAAAADANKADDG